MKRLEKTVEKFSKKDEKKEETPDENFHRKYCPNSLRSVIIFNVYFVAAFLSLVGSFYVTIWA